MQDFDPDEDAITGINVTPLVDITLVLLIIFMVTARFISEPAIGVNLPKSSSSAPTDPAERNVFLSWTPGKAFPEQCAPGSLRACAARAGIVEREARYESRFARG